MKLSTARLLVIVLTALGLLFVGGVMSFLFLPSFAESVRLSGEILKAHAELDAQYEDRKSLLSSLKNAVKAHDDLGGLKVQFLQTGRELDLIRHIEDLAAQEGVTEHFSVQPAEDGPIKEIKEQFDLTIEGDYLKVMRMLVDVERMPILLVTQSGVVHPGQGDTAESPSFVQLDLKGAIVSIPEGL